MRLLLALTLATLLTPEAVCEDSGPAGNAWPQSRWGADDEAGGSNWITPDKVLEAMKLVRTGRIYELGQVYERGMPLYGDRTFALFIPGSPYERLTTRTGSDRSR